MKTSPQSIQEKIYFVRGHRIMLDYDLASLYEVQVKAFNQAIRRNLERFPDDFMFQLTDEEFSFLRSQIVTLEKQGRGKHSKYNPLAFTEQGVAMLSSVLRSKTAIQVNVEIIRAFVSLKRALEGNHELAKKLRELERKYDAQFKIVFDAIRKLMLPPPTHSKRPIGFKW